MRRVSPHPLALLAGLFFMSAGCKPTRDDVRSMLEDRGYTNVQVDPTDNGHGVFHFKAKRSFEDCSGTVLLTSDQKLVSSTCALVDHINPTHPPADSSAP